MKRQFTIIEMLVVIAIIMTLMAMLLGGWSIARGKAQKTKARAHITFMVTAISQYRTTYSLLPYHHAYSSGKPANELADLLIYDWEGSAPSPVPPRPSELLSALYGQDLAANPRGVQFIESGIVEQDPWGNSYRIALDLDYDGNINDDKIFGAGELVKEIVVWSRGPDGKDSSTDNDSVNNDNIHSW